MKYTAVVFDLDGTLVDSYEALTSAVNATLAAEQRSPLERERVRTLVGDGVEMLLERCFGEPCSNARLELFHRSYDEVCCEESRLLEDVAATLDSLRAAGIETGVCTNKPSSFSEKILNHLGLAENLAAIVGPDRAGARKPDPAHLAVTIEMMAADPQTTLYVGDMPIDLATARALGIDCALVATGSAPEAELRALDPDYFLERFSQLQQIVRQPE